MLIMLPNLYYVWSLLSLQQFFFCKIHMGSGQSSIMHGVFSVFVYLLSGCHNIILYTSTWEVIDGPASYLLIASNSHNFLLFHMLNFLGICLVMISCFCFAGSLFPLFLPSLSVNCSFLAGSKHGYTILLGVHVQVVGRRRTSIAHWRQRGDL